MWTKTYEIKGGSVHVMITKNTRAAHAAKQCTWMAKSLQNHNMSPRRHCQHHKRRTQKPSDAQNWVHKPQLQSIQNKNHLIYPPLRPRLILPHQKPISMFVGSGAQMKTIALKWDRCCTSCRVTVNDSMLNFRTSPLVVNPPYMLMRKTRRTSHLKYMQILRSINSSRQVIVTCGKWRNSSSKSKSLQCGTKPLTIWVH